MLSTLRRAETLRPQVIQKVNDFGNSRRAAESLLKAIETDLSDPRARRAFEDHAPAIVQKLAMIDEAKADYKTVRTVELDEIGGGGESLTVVLALNTRARTTLTIIEDFCGYPLADLLGEGVPVLIEQVKDRVQVEFNDYEADGGPMNAGPSTALFIEIQIDTVDFKRQGQTLDVTLAGALTSSFSMSVVQVSADGMGLDDFQGDVNVSGRFTMWATWDQLTAGGVPDSVDCDDSIWDVEGYLSR